MDSMNYQHHHHHPHQQQHQYQHHPHHHHHHHYHPQQQLIQAVKDCNFIKVEELLKQGVSADARDEDGRSVLYWACCRGQVDVCRRLLRRGCDVTTKGKAGTTALMACSDNGHETCLTLLLQHRSIRLDDISDRGDTALHMAAYRGFHKIVGLLCAAGANRSLHNVNGQTPLEVAYIKDNENCIRILNYYDQDHSQRLNGVGAPPTSRQSNIPCQSSILPSPASNDRSKNYSANDSLHLQSFDHVTVSKPPCNDRLLSSDSALGFSVHSSPNSLPSSASHCPQSHELDSTPYTLKMSSSNDRNISNAIGCQSRGVVAPSGNATNMHTFTTHPDSPIEMDERPFFNNRVASNSHPPASAQHSSHFNGREHPDSGNFSDSYYYDANARPARGIQSSGYYSNTKEKKNDEQSSRTLNNNSFLGSLSPSIDHIYQASFTFTTSGEDTSGPPAICYSPAMENDHTKSIYSNTFHNNIPTPVSSTNKRKYSTNNLSSQSTRNEDSLKEDLSNYNIISKSDTIQNFIPNVSPTKQSLKSQNFNSKDLIGQKQITTDETEVLPGLKVSSYLESLQMKLVLLEESLDQERTSNGELQNENKKLKEENMGLKEVIQQLTQKLSKLS